MRNPGIAAVLCFFYTGLGQIYNGQIAKGVFLFVLRVVSDCLTVLLIGWITSPILWVFGMWDAYVTAERRNAGGFV